ncbi:MAG: hypothetical protein WCD47_19080 [Candidatus Sulfotelmatobacter sp.]
MSTLYYGDNLQVLRASVASDTVDLVYLDPPFNSQANYNVLFAGVKPNIPLIDPTAFRKSAKELTSEQTKLF